MNKKYLVIFLVLIIFLFIFLTYCFVFPRKNYETKIQEKMKEFLEDNPNANESYARDVAFHDLAIEEKDSSLCEKIETKWLKKDCLEYFMVSK